MTNTMTEMNLEFTPLVAKPILFYGITNADLVRDLLERRLIQKMETEITENKTLIEIKWDSRLK